jgi:hypothetical protein
MQSRFIAPNGSGETVSTLFMYGIVERFGYYTPLVCYVTSPVPIVYGFVVRPAERTVIDYDISGVSDFERVQLRAGQTGFDTGANPDTSNYNIVTVLDLQREVFEANTVSRSGLTGDCQIRRCYDKLRFEFDCAGYRKNQNEGIGVHHGFSERAFASVVQVRDFDQN